MNMKKKRAEAKPKEYFCDKCQKPIKSDYHSIYCIDCQNELVALNKRIMDSKIFLVPQEEITWTGWGEPLKVHEW